MDEHQAHRFSNTWEQQLLPHSSSAHYSLLPSLSRASACAASPGYDARGPPTSWTTTNQLDDHLPAGRPPAWGGDDHQSARRQLRPCGISVSVFYDPPTSSSTVHQYVGASTAAPLCYTKTRSCYMIYSGSERLATTPTCDSALLLLILSTGARLLQHRLPGHLQHI